MMKAWIGIAFDAQQFVELQEHLSDCNLVTHFHCTLKFLGDVSTVEIETIKQKLSTVHHEGFTVAFGESLIGLPTSANARVAAIALNASELVKLQQKIDRSLSEMFLSESKFLPHITLARGDKIDLPQIKFYLPSVRVTEFYLYESALVDKKVEYKILKKFKL
jgi:2'-5' RNA ligase